MNVYFLTGFFSNQLIFKTRDELSGTQLQVEVLCLAAVEVNAVYGTVKVQNNGISLFRLAVGYGFHAGMSLLNSLQFFLDILIGYFVLDLLYFQTEVILCFNFREASNGCGDFNIFALLQLAQVQFRLIDNFQLQLVQSCRITALQQVVQRFIVEDIFAIGVLDHLSRSLSLTEALDFEAILVVLISIHYSIFELFTGKNHSKLCIIAFFCDKSSFH